ncbi:MAG: acetyltransferase [Clostridia bacterium]|nr:acetyltransferase [Clostridia bacterium]
MTDLIILGVGGLGRETLFQLQQMNKAALQFRILGFADDACTEKTVHDYPVLCNSDALLSREADTAVVIAIGNPVVRRRLFEKLCANPHLSFPSIIAPGAVVSDYVQIGQGCIIGFGAVLTVDITIGDFVLVSNSCNIGHDVVLQDYATLFPAAHISGAVTLGAGCQIGVGSSVIQGLSVGEGAIIGAGAAVVRDIPAHVTAVGVPARVIRTHSQRI